MKYLAIFLVMCSIFFTFEMANAQEYSEAVMVLKSGDEHTGFVTRLDVDDIRFKKDKSAKSSDAYKPSQVESITFSTTEGPIKFMWTTIKYENRKGKIKELGPFWMYERDQCSGHTIYVQADFDVNDTRIKVKATKSGTITDQKNTLSSTEVSNYYIKDEESEYPSQIYQDPMPFPKMGETLIDHYFGTKSQVPAAMKRAKVNLSNVDEVMEFICDYLNTK